MTQLLRAIILFIVLFLTTWVLTELTLYSRNIPLKYDGWMIEKAMVNKLMGGEQAMSQRQLVARNRFNLSEWYGTNALVVNDLFSLGSMELDFQLEKEAYIHVLFNRDRDGFDGFRLSRHPEFPSISYSSNFAGKFLRKKEMNLTPAIDGSRHRLKITVTDSKAILIVDGREVVEARVTNKSAQTVCVRGSMRKCWIDNLVVTDKNGLTIIDESFRNNDDFADVFFLFFVLMLLFTVLMYVLFKKHRSTRSVVICTTVLAQIGIIAGLWLSFDFYYWSARYHLPDYKSWILVKNPTVVLAEQIRIKGFSVFDGLNPDRWSELSNTNPPQPITNHVLGIDTRPQLDDLDLQLSGGVVPQGYLPIPDTAEALKAFLNDHPSAAQTIKIVLIGTSQTWGEGATAGERGLAVRLQKKLDESSTTEILMINSSIRGSNSSILVPRYEKAILPMKPTIVLVNLGLNDSFDNNAFKENMQRLVEMNQAHGISTVLSAEPLSPGHKGLTNHKTLKALAEKHQLPFLDTYTKMNAEDTYDAGFLWWDKIHPSEFGHELIAQILADLLTESFPQMFLGGLPENDLRDSKM